MPCSTSMAAEVTAPRCGRAPAPSVIFTASARPFSGKRLGQQFGAVGRHRRRHFRGDNKAPGVKLVLQVAGHPIQVAKSSGRCKGNNGKNGGGSNAAQLCRPHVSTGEIIDDAIAPISDGCMLVVPREVSGVPMAATRALIRRGVKRIHLVALPTSSLQADLLIGAGCIETLETSAVSLGEFGPAPRFTAAVTSGAIKMKDATCPALHAALAGVRKRRAVHAAARAYRLGCPEISRRLESDRQPVRQ